MADPLPDHSRTRFWNGVMVLSMTGAVGCGYLLHLALGPETEGLCEVLGSSCGATVRAKSHHLGGFSPVSLGLGYFSGHFVYAALMRFRRSCPHPAAVAPLLLIGLPGLAVSVYFCHLLTFVLERPCAVCIGIHVVNALLFGATARQAYLHRTAVIAAIGGICSDGRIFRAGLLALVLAANATLFATIVELRYDLTTAQHRIKDNLAYYRYLYDKAPVYYFGIGPRDAVVGEPGIAIHQIVCFYREACPHCRQAKNHLIPMVKRHDTAVYLVLKNAAHLSADTLQSLDIQRVPAVFIDGKFAAGWQLDGFLDRFVNDCGC